MTEAARTSQKIILHDRDWETIMSKKSRRRNKRILGALAAIGTGLALANRGKGMESSNISVGGGRDAASMDTSLKMPNRKMGIIPRKNKNFLANPKINKMDLSEVDFVSQSRSMRPLFS